MRTRRMLIGIAALASFVTVGCVREPERVREPRSVKVAIGSTVSAKGDIPPRYESDDFLPGESVFVSAKLPTLRGRAVTVRWTGPNDLFVRSQTARVNDRGVVVFSLFNTAGFPSGDYRVTLSSGATTIAAEEFHMIDNDPAGAGDMP